MLEAAKRQELVNKLRNRVKKASSNVSTKVEAHKGDFKVVLTSDTIDHFYKNEKVASIKVSELDADDVALINDGPGEAAQEILSEFMSSFDVNEHVASSNSMTKEAANKSQDESQLNMVTEKQLTDNSTKLHPRTNESYTNITQKQLPEHGQRPGTYEVTTEAQFRDERKTFYGTARTSGDWRGEDRNLVTEGQFNKGVGEFTEVAASDRGEIGSKFDGDAEKQQTMIGEKQLMELLKHHKWSEPLTVTEGKDQLGKQDGELARLTAEVAQKIVKEALTALGKTVLACGITSPDLAEVVKRLVSDPSKYNPLANTIRLYSKSDVSTIDKKIARARQFGKTANVGSEWSDTLAADVLIRQISKMNYNPSFIVDGLVALSSRQDFVDKISKATDSALTESENKPSQSSNLSVFADAIDGKPESVYTAGSADEDGRYAYAGVISEVQSDPTDKEKFKTAATEFARKQIVAQVGKEINLDPQIVSVDMSKDMFEVQFVDKDFVPAGLEARAARRRELVKTAGEIDGTKTAQMGGMGGSPAPAGGGSPEMANPTMPPGGADMGAAPVGESLSQEPPPEEGAEAGPSGEPKPPGSVCPACGSEDVDLDNGDFRCNNCGGEGTLHVNIEMKKWTGTINESDTEEKEGFGLDEGLGAEDSGMAMSEGEGTGTTLPNVPVAASSSPWAATYRVNPKLLEKLASQKINIGTVCPNCGSNKTDISKSATTKGQDGICWDCLQEYNFQVKTLKDKKGPVVAQYIWKPTTLAQCNDCNRLKKAFVESLDNYGVKWNEFSNLSNSDQAKLVLKMAKGGWLNLDEAMQSPLPVTKIAASARWNGYQKFDKFPSSTCVERIARRYGENATSMSGPCQGKKLAECVCSQLESLGIYTDGLAAKVASMQRSKNPVINSPMKTCIAMFVRDYSLEVDDACIVCNAMRAAHASEEELVLEAIAQINPMSPKPMNMSPKPMKPMSAPGLKPMPAKPMMGPGGAPSPKPMPSAKPMMGPGSPMSPSAKPMMGGDVGGGMGGGMPGMTPKPMDGMPGMTPKPMDGLGGLGAPKPLDEPVVDGLDGGLGEPGMDGGMGGMDGGMGEDPISNPTDTSGDLSLEMDFGPTMGPDSSDIGLEGDTITIQLPSDAAQALQTLMQALQGQIGGDMIDTTGDDLLDVGDITEETVDDGESSESEGSESEGSESEGSESGESDDIPGLAEESSESEGLVKDSEPEDSKPPFEASAKQNVKEATNQKSASVKTAPVVQEAVATEVTKTASLDSALSAMKKGTNKTYQSSLDSVFEGLMKQAKFASKDDSDIKKTKSVSGKDSKVTVAPAQNTDGIGKYKDSGKIGHEEPFSKGVNTKPDVPRGSALMGDEGEEVKVSESGDLPTVPHGSPAMAGEEHYRPEKGNALDGNQGGQKAASTGTTNKSAACKCKCGNPACTCKGCESGSCMKPCHASTKERDNMKTAKTWKVAPDHKYYAAFSKKASAGETSIKLTDGILYDMLVDENKNIVLTAKNKNSDTIKKESQTVSPKKVENLEDDPDLNKGGKTHGDKAHSLGVDEKKPSDGMESPSVPEAPNGGRLGREHTVEKATEGPEIPAGGGMHSEYDKNEKNKPEKVDQMLGKSNEVVANSRDEAIKIAGQMLKAQMISVDELPSKINELSNATQNVRDDYKKMITQSFETRGMTRQASAGSIENPVFVKTAETKSDGNDAVSAIQGLFTIDKRNKDYERLAKDNTRLWR